MFPSQVISLGKLNEKWNFVDLWEDPSVWFKLKFLVERKLERELEREPIRESLKKGPPSNILGFKRFISQFGFYPATICMGIARP